MEGVRSWPDYSHIARGTSRCRCRRARRCLRQGAGYTRNACAWLSPLTSGFCDGRKWHRAGIFGTAPTATAICATTDPRLNAVGGPYLTLGAHCDAAIRYGERRERVSITRAAEWGQMKDAGLVSRRTWGSCREFVTRVDDHAHQMEQHRLAAARRLLPIDVTDTWLAVKLATGQDQSGSTSRCRLRASNGSLPIRLKVWCASGSASAAPVCALAPTHGRVLVEHLRDRQGSIGPSACRSGRGGHLTVRDLPAHLLSEDSKIVEDQNGAPAGATIEAVTKSEDP
jgi:hypothetical protein